MMKIEAYHALFEQGNDLTQPDLTEIARALAKNGLSPVLQESREVISRRLQPFGLALPEELLRGGPAEIFTAGDGSRAIFFACRATARTSGRSPEDDFRYPYGR